MERTELNKKIGQNIRKYRLKIDISQENLAICRQVFILHISADLNEVKSVPQQTHCIKYPVRSV